jgi:hypothetical protein
MLVWRRQQPSAAKAEFIHSSYVRPEGRTLQRNEFFRCLVGQQQDVRPVALGIRKVVLRIKRQVGL